MHGRRVLQVGDDVMRDNFWNYGQCAQLQQQFKEPPEELALKEFLGTADNVRWGAVLPYLLRPLLLLCPSAVRCGYEQVRCRTRRGTRACMRDMSSARQLRSRAPAV